MTWKPFNQTKQPIEVQRASMNHRVESPKGGRKVENSELYRAVDPLEGTMRKALRQEGALMKLMQRESEPLELDCSTDLLPSPGGRKATVMADGNTITKHLFDHYRLAMYSHLNRALRNGTLSDVVGFKILDGVINRQVCRFPMGGVSFWKIDRKNIYADVKVELKLHSNAGIRIWQGVLVCIISFETEVRFSVEEITDSVDHENDGCVRLSPFLIAYYNSKMIDSIGETILRKYMPEALTDPSKRDPVELARRMGLNVIYEEVYNHRGVGSILFFKEGDLMVGGKAVSNEVGMEVVRRLKGKKHIIIGNHDTDTRIKLYQQEASIVEVQYAKMMRYKGRNLYLSHYPTFTANLEHEKPKQWIINFFGHTHTKERFFNGIPFMYNVALDAHDNRPVLLDDALREIKERAAAPEEPQPLE